MTYIITQFKKITGAHPVSLKRMLETNG